MFQKNKKRENKYKRKKITQEDRHCQKQEGKQRSHH